MDKAVLSRHSPFVELPTALVIDDEPVIRQLIRRTLEPTICRVAEAESAEAGLRIIQRGSPAIDLVLTDIRMPGLNGWDVVEVLARHRPDLPVAVISGYDANAAAAARLLGTPILLKPFTLGALMEVVKRLTDEARRKQTRVETSRPRIGRLREMKPAGRRQHADLRPKLDLVSAAWEVHRHPHYNP